MLSLKAIIIVAGILAVKGQNLTAGIPCNTSALPFHCHDNTTCISRYSFCNNVAQCPDGSDELVYSASTSSRGMQCQFNHPVGVNIINKLCHLPDRYKCDHELDCVGGFDECGCRHTFQCQNRNCVIKIQFCDGASDCADGTDERLFNRSAGIGFQCPVSKRQQTKDCILPDQYVCDGDSDCDHGIDECFCDNSTGKMTYVNASYSSSGCFRCLDRSLIIPNKQFCDGTVHCQDLSDECLCLLKKNHTVPVICNSICNGNGCPCPGKVRCLSNRNQTQWICLEPTSICDDRVDCLNGIDESYCPQSDQYFTCSDKLRKVPKQQICDGARDCLDGSDEWNCSRLNDYYCNTYRPFFPFVTDWDNRTQTDLVVIPPFIGRLSSLAPLYAKRCDGVADCLGLDDECYATGNNCSTLPEYCMFTSSATSGFRCNNSASSITGKEVCDGFPSCYDTRPAESIDELFCPNRFYCKDRGRVRLPIHIPMEARCDGIQDCTDQSDELGCSNNTHFYCRDSGTKLFVRRSEVCDGTQDCSSGADECVGCTNTPFSSDNKLIKSRPLVGFLWIIGIIALIGNLLVMIHQLRCLIKPDGIPNQVSIINGVLVLNLSVADLLVGIYLVSIGIKDASISRYCIRDQEWRGSSTCAGLGTIALIGTETSVFILVIMTAYRLFLVMKPFKKENHYFVILGVVAAWIFALILALVPHSASLQDYFLSCVWYRHNRFFGSICRNNFTRFAQELRSKYGFERFPSLRGGVYNWKNMFDAVAQFNSSYRPERFFGYYSAHGVCLPRLFPNRLQDDSWGYSLFLILFNFCAFVFILTAYFQIYRITTKKQAALLTGPDADKNAMKLPKKITRIVATDFCCWIPICIMAFVKVSGGYVSDIAYAFTAIILLPINAAMNPFLYSDILDIIWDKMMPARQWFNATAMGRAIGKMSTRETAEATDGPENVTATTAGGAISTTGI